MDRHLPANAGNTGSIPGAGRPHVPQGTKPLHHNEESSLLTAVKRNPVVSDKDRVQPKNFKKFIIKKIKFTNKLKKM